MWNMSVIQRVAAPKHKKDEVHGFVSADHIKFIPKLKHIYENRYSICDKMDLIP
jgi:hypothetical protein